MASFPIQRLQVRARITAPAAAVEVIQTFTNPYSEPLEVTYVFPLSAAAAVVRFKLMIGQRVLEGTVLERGEAEEQYQSATTMRLVAALLEKERAHVLSVRVGSLPPGEPVTVEIAYGEKLHYLWGEYQFRFPLLMSPRFVADTALELFAGGGTLEPETARDGRFGARLATGLDRAALSISVHVEASGLAPARVSCSQRAVTQGFPNGDFAVELAEPGELMDRDFVLSFNPWCEQKPVTWLRANGEHFLLSVLPPTNPLPGGASRDLVVLIDGSENVVGPKFDSLRRSVGLLLRSLSADERFAIVCFNRDLAGYRQGIFCGSEEVAQGLQWLAQFEPRGRADLTILLERVLQLQPEGNRLLSVVLFTGGHVGTEKELFDKVRMSASPIRFFSMGIDSVVNDIFLLEVARLTYGSSFLLTPGEDPELTMKQLVEDTRQPMLVDFQLVDRGLGPRRESLVPDKIGHLSYNRPINLFGIRSGDGGLEIRGNTPAGQVWGEAVNPAQASNPALAVVWANEKVLELQRELFLHTGTHSNQIRQQILALSKKYRLLTDYTAFVIVDSQQGAQSPGVRQPVLVPREWVLEAAPEAAAEDGHARRGLRGNPGEERGDARPILRKGLRSRAEAIQGLKLKVGAGPKLEIKVKIGGPKKDMFGDKPMLPSRGKEDKLESPSPAPAVSYPAGHPEPEAPPDLPPPAPPHAVPVPPERPPDFSAPLPEDVSVPPEQPRGASVPPPPPVPMPQPVATAVSAVSAPAAVDSGAAPSPTPVPAGNQTARLETESPMDHAKRILNLDADFRARIMAGMRALHISLGQSGPAAPDPNLGARMEVVLRMVADLAPSSPVFKQVLEVGAGYYRLFQSGDPEGLSKLQFWLQRFALLFR